MKEVNTNRREVRIKELESKISNLEKQILLQRDRILNLEEEAIKAHEGSIKVRRENIELRRAIFIGEVRESHPELIPNSPAPKQSDEKKEWDEDSPELDLTGGKSLN